MSHLPAQYIAWPPRDTTVGVDYMGARVYVPELGVWASPDPVRLSDPERLVGAHPSASAYAYANNNPIAQVDREGTFAWVVAAAVVVGILITTQYANAPTSADTPLLHKGTGELALDMAHNSATLMGAAGGVGLLANTGRAALAGDVVGALKTTANVAKGAAAAEMVGDAADAVDSTGTARKVLETASGMAVRSVKAPRPRPPKPNPLKEYFKTLKADTRSAAERLPQMKGSSVPGAERVLTKHGFTQTKVSNSVARNQTWDHSDGSQVRIHPYGNQNTSQYRSANNAHIHKQDASGGQLTDRGIPSADPAQTHIGIRNPANLPAVRGRPHGAGTQ